MEIQIARDNNVMRVQRYKRLNKRSTDRSKRFVLMATVNTRHTPEGDTTCCCMIITMLKMAVTSAS